MEKEKQFTVAENLTVMVEPDKKHEFLITSAEVAKKYGISTSALRKHSKDRQQRIAPFINRQTGKQSLIW